MGDVLLWMSSVFIRIGLALSGYLGSSEWWVIYWFYWKVKEGVTVFVISQPYVKVFEMLGISLYVGALNTGVFDQLRLRSGRCLPACGFPSIPSTWAFVDDYFKLVILYFLSVFQASSTQAGGGAVWWRLLRDGGLHGGELSEDRRRWVSTNACFCFISPPAIPKVDSGASMDVNRVLCSPPPLPTHQTPAMRFGKHQSWSSAFLVSKADRPTKPTMNGQLKHERGQNECVTKRCTLSSPWGKLQALGLSLQGCHLRFPTCADSWPPLSN